MLIIVYFYFLTKYQLICVTVKNNGLRKHISCLRLFSHKLEIETGRYYGITRENRICKCCTSGMIETEFQFHLCCTLYKEPRVKYLGNTHWPALHMFEYLMSTKSSKKMLSL